VSAFRIDDVALDVRQARLQLLHQRHEGEIEHHQPISRVVHDVDELILEEARVHGVIDRADARDAVPGFEVSPRVPGQRRDPVAGPDPLAVETFCDPECPAADLAVGRAMHRSLDRAGQHGPVAMLDRRVVDDAMHEKGPVLHQAEHRSLRRTAAWCGSVA